MTTLGMDDSLVNKKGSSSSLETIWKRYAAIQKALSEVGDVDWESGVKKPSPSEIVSVYGGRSTFYEQAKVLHEVKTYSNMVEWLERVDTDMDVTTELWGFHKIMYTLKDLKKWLEEKKVEAEKVKRKGKGKGKSSPPVKRVHKKLRK